MASLDAPNTKLPYYDLLSRTHSNLAPPRAEFHEIAVSSVTLPADREATLKAFASFVSAVTELPRVAFVAKYTSETTGAAETRLAIASTCSADKPHSYSSDATQVTLVQTGAIDGDEFDFEIQLDVKDEARRPFVLSVSSSDLKLSFDAAHGPHVSASHLANLAAAYLTSHTATTTPTAIHPAALNYPPAQTTPPLLKVDVAADAASPALLHSAFERRVAQTPDAIAVEYVEDKLENVQKLTYKELNQNAEDLATELSTAQKHLAQWKPTLNNQRAVPLFIPGSPAFYTGVMGIMKAGMAFCPLPLDAPPQRLVDILEDVQATVVLGVGAEPFAGVDMSSLSDAGKEIIKNVVWLDMTNISAWRSNDTSIQPITDRTAPTPDDLAYILYTSGSTGKPKGVMIGHRMVTTSISVHAEVFEPFPSGPELRWLQFGMPTFDLTMVEIFLTMSYGGTLCVGHRRLMLSDVEAAINFFQATAVTCVPTMATLVRPQNVPTLRNMVCGGEIVTKYAIDNFSYDATVCSPAKRLINVYGPTEATINNTAEVTQVGNRGSIAGGALSCCSIIIADEHKTDELAPMPMGLPGEIILAGDLVGYGYLNRPEESARAFTSGLGFDRAYRTGDKGRIVWTPEGIPKLEVLGRLSMEQVKLNARRVELGEIESTIVELPEVREIATVVLDGSFLVAYIALNGENAASTEYQDSVIAKCRAAAEQGLPDWMRPVDYAVVSAIPRITSGKTDRKTLQAQALRQFGAASLEQASSDDLPALDFSNEASVTAHIKFALESVLPKDALADTAATLKSCGLDSLRTMKFLQEARKLGIQHVGMDTVYASSTLADLVANTISQHHRATTTTPMDIDDDEDIPELEDEEQILEFSLSAKLKHFAVTCRPTCVKTLNIPSEQIAHVFPATGLQTRGLACLEESRAFGVCKAWVEHYPYNVPSHLDLPRLEAAIKTAMEGYDAFRTMWVQVEHPLSAFAQAILTKDSPRAAHPIVKITVPSYSADPASLWNQTLIHAQRAAEDTFGLNSLCAVTTIIQSADGQHSTIVFSMYHVIYDGLSLRRLATDISRIYEGLPVPGESKSGMLAPVESHFSADMLAVSMHWTMKLAGIPPFKAGPRIIDSSAAHAPFSSLGVGTRSANQSLNSRVTYDDLFSKSQDLKLPSPMAIVQAAWSMALGRTIVDRSGDVDVQFAGLFHGRQTPEALEVFALMLHSCPTRVTFLANQKRTHRDICNDTYTQYVENLPFMEVPCPNVQYARATRRFDSSLVLQVFPETSNNVPTEGFPLFDRVVDAVDPWQETNGGNPLMMEVVPSGDKGDDSMCIRLGYSECWPGYDFMTPGWVRGVVFAFDEALYAILNEPDAVFDVTQ